MYGEILYCGSVVKGILGTGSSLLEILLQTYLLTDAYKVLTKQVEIYTMFSKRSLIFQACKTHLTFI